MNRFRFRDDGARAEKQRAWAEEQKSNGSKPGHGNRPNVGDRQADSDLQRLSGRRIARSASVVQPDRPYEGWRFAAQDGQASGRRNPTRLAMDPAYR